WIGEWQTELDCVGACGFESFDNAWRRFAIGIAARDIRNYGAALFREERLSARHCAACCIAMICGTSLSPRPERFAITIAPSGIDAPLRNSQPNACDDSSAGMIPSVSLSLWNASSA